MDYRSILVYLDDTERTQELVALAADLAKQHRSHLIGVAPTGIVELPGKPRQALDGDEYIPLTAEALYRRAHEVAMSFEAQARQLGLTSFESRVDEAEPTDSIIGNACCADLLVISQSDHHAPTPTVPWGFPQRVVLGAGRPTLVVPREGSFAALNPHVLLCWNGSREALRAATDALPLLKSARKLEILEFEEASRDRPRRSQRLMEFLAWLRRHGVHGEPIEARFPPPVGDALIAEAAALGADMIVMGAYGHMRLSELVLGGATRSMLEGMKVPVLMSH